MTEVVTEAPQPNRRVIRTREVDERYGLSRHLRTKLTREGEFPQPIVLYEGSGKRPPIYAYFEDEVESWLARRPRVKNAVHARQEGCPA